MRFHHQQLLTVVAILALFCLSNSQAAHHQAHERIADAANTFLDSLTPELSKKALFTFDNPNRVSWEFLPQTMIGRKGVKLTDLNDRQKKLAYALLASSLSEGGYKKLSNIIDLERVLLELTGSDMRVPEYYSVAIFVTPSTDKNWGWRFEGHHISLNITVVDGDVIATAPRFLGSNPAEVPEGDRKGLRALGNEEDLGRKLLKSMDAKQLKQVIFQEVPFPEIVTNRATEVSPLKAVGLQASKMSDKQKALLRELIEAYAHTMPKELAKKRMTKIEEAGFNKIRFGWAGGSERGDAHYYRVQGPSFLIEYDNVQNNANHAHTVWRDFDGDFGKDLLGEHYMNHSHKH